MGTDFFRWLMMWICTPIYKAIPRLYSIFYFIANARFLSEGVVDDMSTNLYVLISVIMLFAFSATLLSAIVNPDMLSDNKKGLGAIFKRAIVGVMLIVLIPVAFDLAYDFQGQIMKNAVIEKIILGINYSEDAEEGKGGNGGQVIAGTLMYSVLYPATDNIEISADEDVSQAYVDMIETDLEENIDTVADHINIEPSDENSEYKYAFKFDSLVALIAGIATLYILLLFAIDMAIRMFKLAFLELTAPLSVMSYIAVGDEVFSKWRKEVLTTYASVFIRMAAMGFYLFMISNLNTFFETPELWGQSENAAVESINGFGWKLLLEVIIIVGLLVFVKKVPEMIESMMGVKLDKGGIKGKLKDMAGADLIKKSLKTLPRVGMLAGATAASGLGKVVKGIDNNLFGGKGQEIAQKFREKLTKDRGAPFEKSDSAAARIFGRGLNKLIQAPTAMIKGTGNVGKAVKAAAGSKTILGVKDAVNKALEEDPKFKQKQYELEQKENAQIAGSANLDPVTKRSATNVLSELSTGFKDSKVAFGREFRNAAGEFDIYQNAKLRAAAIEKAIDNDQKIDDAFKIGETSGRISKEARAEISAIRKQVKDRTLTKEEAIDQLVSMEKSGAIDYGLRASMTEALAKGIYHEQSMKHESIFGDEFKNIQELSTGALKGLKEDYDKKVDASKAALENAKLTVPEDKKGRFDKYINQVDNQASEWNRIASQGTTYKAINSSPVSGQSIPSSTQQTINQPQNTSTQTITGNTQADPILQRYANEGFGQNSQGYYYNPNTDEYDSNYDPRKDPAYLRQDSSMQNYRNAGYGQNSEGSYYNPNTDNYDANYNPRTDSAFNTNNSSSSNNQSLDNQNITSQNVTINANTADVNTSSANINGNKFEMNGEFNNNSNNNVPDFENATGSSDDVVEAIEELDETIKSSARENADAVNKNNDKNARKETEQLKKMNNNLDNGGNNE